MCFFQQSTIITFKRGEVLLGRWLTLLPLHVTPSIDDYRLIVHIVVSGEQTLMGFKMNWFELKDFWSFI